MPGPGRSPEARPTTAPVPSQEVQVGQAQLGQPLSERVDWGSRESQVRCDVEVGNEGRLLVDEDQARSPCLRRGMDLTWLPSNQDAPRSPGAPIPVSTLTRVLLPAPLAPISACTSPGPHAKRGIAERPHRPIALADAGGVEQQIRHGHAFMGPDVFEGVPSRHPLWMVRGLGVTRRRRPGAAPSCRSSAAGAARHKRPGRVEHRWHPRAALSTRRCLPRTTLSHASGVSQREPSRPGSGRQDLKGARQPGATDRTAELVTAAPTRPGYPRQAVAPRSRNCPRPRWARTARRRS